MKKIVLLFSFFVMSVAGITHCSAQITLGTNDFPSSGKIYNLSTATPFMGMDATLTGANYTWDYTPLDTTRNGTRVDTFLTLQQTAQLYALAFANGAHASNQAITGANFSLSTYINVTNAYNFFENNSTSYNQTGFGADISVMSSPVIPTPVPYTPQDVVYKYPVNYGNVDSSNSAYNISAPGLLYYGVNMTRHNIVDGWGTLITPFGTFNALRIKSTVTSQDSVYLDTLGFGIKLPPTTTVQYKWLGQGMGDPLLQINMTGTTVSSIAFMDSLRVGIAEIDKPLKDFIVFPNPATEMVLLQYSLSSASDVHIDITDVTGAIIVSSDEKRQQAGSYIKKIDLSPTLFSSGNYFVRVSTAGSQLIKPLVIAK